MLKGEINVTNMKSLQLFSSSQHHFIPKFICWHKHEILFTFDTKYMFCTDFGRGGRYGELLEAKGEGMHKHRQILTSIMLYLCLKHYKYSANRVQHLVIKLFNIFRVSHNNIVVNDFGLAYSEILPTYIHRKGRLVWLKYSSFPSWGMKNCFCHFLILMFLLKSGNKTFTVQELKSTHFYMVQQHSLPNSKLAINPTV